MKHEDAITRCCLLLLLSVLSTRTLAGEGDHAKFNQWPTQLRINGTVVVAGELNDLSILKVVLSKSERETGGGLLCLGELAEETTDSIKSMFDDEAKVSIETNPDDITTTLTGLLESNEVVLLHFGQSVTSPQQKQLVAAKSKLNAFINKGGTLISVGEAGECLGGDGVNVIPDSVIQLNYAGNEKARNELSDRVKAHPQSVGIGVEKDTALVFVGRKMIVTGKGQATFLLPASEQASRREQKVAARKYGRPTEEQILDYTQWRRMAIDRTLEPFPAAKPDKPFVENGSLVIVGGGGMPRGLMSKFIELAGGVKEAKLVYVPCSEDDDVGNRHPIVESWKKLGVKHATFIHTKDRNQANTDEEFLAPLKDATGIWFGGGRQWNLADSYYGTKAQELMLEVVKRGGVAGGSSAGASIQGRYLARSAPLGNRTIMAPGYERGGLEFLTGVAIDQHFSQRKRQKDMTSLVDKYPQLLGIGLDEATAIIVQKSKAKVVGRGKAFFYDRNQPVVADAPDYTALADGSEYDLATRKVLVNAEEKEE